METGFVWGVRLEAQLHSWLRPGTLCALRTAANRAPTPRAADRRPEEDSPTPIREVPMHRTGRSLLPASLALTAVPALAADRYVLVSHAPDSDSWWNTIKNALKEADKDFGVQTDYRNPPSGDLAPEGPHTRAGLRPQLQRCGHQHRRLRRPQEAAGDGHREEDPAHHHQLRHHDAEREPARDTP